MSYPGSKAQAGTWQRIIGQMPPHDVYIEGFAGSGQVFLRKRPAARSFLIDKNPSIIDPQKGWYRHEFVGDCLQILPVLLTVLDPNAKVCVYLDPPYPLDALKSKGRRYYEHVMSDDAHRRLLKMVRGYPTTSILISGYDCPLYREMLHDWRFDSWRMMTRGGPVTECLWCNFPLPDELHDLRYAGANYRRRAKLKLKVGRWVKKLDSMDPREREALLHEIRQRREWS